MRKVSRCQKLSSLCKCESSRRPLFTIIYPSPSFVVSMVWNYVGTGCFQYNTYHQIAATTKESCLDRCQNDVRCAFVVYRKHKCALCTEEYKPKASCLHDVELIAKGMFEDFHTTKRINNETFSLDPRLVISRFNPHIIFTPFDFPGHFA